MVSYICPIQPFFCLLSFFWWGIDTYPYLVEPSGKALHSQTFMTWLCWKTTLDYSQWHCWAQSVMNAKCQKYPYIAMWQTAYTSTLLAPRGSSQTYWAFRDWILEKTQCQLGQPKELMQNVLESSIIRIKTDNGPDYQIWFCWTDEWRALDCCYSPTSGTTHSMDLVNFSLFLLSYLIVSDFKPWGDSPRELTYLTLFTSSQTCVHLMANLVLLNLTLFLTVHFRAVHGYAATHMHITHVLCFSSILPPPCGCIMSLISIMPVLDSISRFDINMYTQYDSI